MHNFILTFFLLVLFSHPASAYMPPPAKIIESSVTPSCITIQESFLAGQLGGQGTGSKGAAIKLNNGCSAGIVITDIQTATAENPVKKSVSQVDARLLTTKDNVKTYKGFVFAGDDESCKTAAKKVEKILQEAKEREEQIKHTRKSLKEKGLKDPWEEQQALNPTKTEDTELACKNLFIPAGGSLTVAMPWGTLYTISGHSEKSEIFDVNIKGKIINPQYPDSQSDDQKSGTKKAP